MITELDKENFLTKQITIIGFTPSMQFRKSDDVS